MDNRFQTLTIVDLAGSCPSDQVYLSKPEINKSTSHVRTLLKTLTSHAPHKSSSSSKIYKELESLLINGNAKLNILHLSMILDDKAMADDEYKGVRMPLMRNKKEKFNKMFIEYQTLREMID